MKKNASVEKKVKFVVEKDDVVRLKIDDIGADGEGIGKVDGYTLFVKDAVIGDVVNVKVIKTKKSFGYGRLLDIIEPSPYRVTPVCSVARQCGGCQLQHLEYAEQLKYKENKIKNCLVRIGKFDEEFVDSVREPIIGMEKPLYYRNKAQFPVGVNKEGDVVTGFYAGRTHSIIDTSHCFIQAEVNEVILGKVRAFLKEYGISIYDEKSHTGLVRHVLTRVGFVTKEIMVCVVINGDVLPYSENLVDSLKEVEGMMGVCLNINKANTNVILGEKIERLWGKGFITDYIGEVKYQISPLSFYQVNPVQTRRLYETALEFAGLSGEEVVWDLYCGIGTISLFLAKKAKMVYGVEIVEQAIEDAKKNAEINGIENVRFYVGAAEEVFPKVFREEGVRGDVVVVDPPRKGCDVELLDTIVRMKPDRVVYVSCDPGTLARDLRYLAENGYEVKRWRGCDMFPETVHVETIVQLSRRNV